MAFTDLEQLQQSDAARFLADNFPAFVSYITPDFRYAFANKRYEPMMNRPVSEIEGKLVAELWPEAVSGKLLGNIQRALDGELLQFEQQVGETTHFSSYIPHVDSGKVAGVLILSHDITELADARGAVIQAEKSAALSRLLASLLHEINTPLGAIASGLDSMTRTLTKLRTMLGEVDPKIERVLGILDELAATGGHGASQIQQTMGTLRCFVSVDQAEVQRVDVHTGLDASVALVAPDVPAGVTIHKEYAELPKIECRPAELNQVFMHLLSNALNAIGGEGTITVRTAVEDGEVHIAVRDTGKGIEPDDIPRLFDPKFSRSDAKVKAGLGLFVSYDVVKKHGGHIDVQSEIGKGTTMTVVLPRDARVSA